MSDAEFQQPSLFDELKRRRVVRVALVYGASAFAVLQAADILVPALHLPAWTVTLVVVLLALGFPLALALSWVLELTPEGIRVTPRAAPADAAAASAVPALLGRRTLLVSGVLVLAGVAFGAGWVLGPETRAGGADGSAARSVSVAVLPFADLSDDRSQEYFGDGIAEELLNTLRSSDVAVASRTSSFAFKDRNVSLREIARELGVDQIVEGSVRKHGTALHLGAGNRRVLRPPALVADVRTRGGRCLPDPGGHRRGGRVRPARAAVGRGRSGLRHAGRPGVRPVSAWPLPLEQAYAGRLAARARSFRGCDAARSWLCARMGGIEPDVSQPAGCRCAQSRSRCAEGGDPKGKRPSSGADRQGGRSGRHARRPSLRCLLSALRPRTRRSPVRSPQSDETVPVG